MAENIELHSQGFPPFSCASLGLLPALFRCCLGAGIGVTKKFMSLKGLTFFGHMVPGEVISPEGLPGC